ncbi:MAG: hypothetical protein Q9M11_02480, partial [Mariprofundaceae bacterium]|nr:hypothetical protein [Mariprofundaceae bacterium]
MAWAFLGVIYASRYFHFRYVLSGTMITVMDMFYAMLWPACLSFMLAAIAFSANVLCAGLESWLALMASMFSVFLFVLICFRWLRPLREECLEIWVLLTVFRNKVED